MPEPASSRSLEDILASIRQSLADESVDGLVELSAAAVDAARAEQSRGARPSTGLPVPDGAAYAGPASAADSLADDLLRDKLAGALVIETEVAEEETAAEDEAASAFQSEAKSGAHDLQTDEPGVDASALAKLWVLRPGIEQARPAPSGASASLSLDPFANAPTASDDTKPAAEFAFSPLELLGRATPIAKPLPTMPPVPQSPAADAATPDAPARAIEGAAPPRLDPASVALLEKLRASNAAAIEKIAQSNVESEEAPPPASAVDETAQVASEDESAPEAEAPAVAPFAELLQSVSKVEAAPSAPEEPTADAPVVAPPEPSTVEENVRPLLTLPERSTPLFGGQADARPPLTSGLDHLLPEAGAAPLHVEDEAADVGEPEPQEQPVVEAIEQPVAELAAEPAAEVAMPAVSDPEPIPDVSRDDATASHLPEAASEEAAVAAPGANKALEDMIAAVLEPVLQRLIETSIGPALETLVRREVERVLKEQRPPE